MTTENNKKESEGEIKSKEVILKPFAHYMKQFGVPDYLANMVTYAHALNAMEAYASQFTASKEKEYRELLEEVDFYLSRTHYEKGKPVYSNNIGAGSILHKKIKEALNK